MGYNQYTAHAAFYLPDVVETWVNAIQSGGAPVFRTGYWSELREINAGLGRINSGVRYPIVYLPINYRMNYLNQSSDFKVTFELYLIHSSEKNYSTDQRLDNVIKTTLEPIYADLINEIRDTDWTGETLRVPDHEKEYITFNVEQGEKQNQLNEVVEAIHLSFSINFTNLNNY